MTELEDYSIIDELDGYTINELAELFPGHWGCSYYSYYLCIEGQKTVIEIVYIRSVNLFRLVHDTSVNDTDDIDIVKRFYKTHTKLRAFK